MKNYKMKFLLNHSSMKKTKCDIMINIAGCNIRKNKLGSNWFISKFFFNLE